MRKQTGTMQLQILLATMLVTLSCKAQTIVPIFGTPFENGRNIGFF